MGWLDGELTEIIAEELPAADMAIDLAYVETTPGTIDLQTQMPGDGTVTEHECQGYVASNRQRYFDRGVITKGERVVVVYAGTLAVKPKVDEHITARGEQGRIEEVGTDEAEALWILGVTP